MSTPPAASGSPTDQAQLAPAYATAELRVLVLAGGLSYERDVSLRSGRRVLDALRDRRRRGGTARRRRGTAARAAASIRRTPWSSHCTGRPVRTARCAACSTCATCRTSAATPARVPARLGQALRQGGAARGRHPDAGLGGAAARPVLRARRGRGAGPDRRPARAAADGQAGTGRIGTGCRGGTGRRRAAGRDGRLLRVRLDRAGRAVRARHGRGGLRRRPGRRAARAARGRDRARATACTTTRPATPPV